MNITYDDFGKALETRENLGQCEQTLNAFEWVLQQALNAAVDSSSSTLKPRTVNGTQMTPFYGNGQGPQYSVSYTPGDGFGYPTGKLNLTLGSPDNYTDVRLVFTVEFFDVSHITVSLDVNPTVRARFDTNNVDQTTMDIFIYGILGATPYLADAASNFFYNNVSAV